MNVEGHDKQDGVKASDVSGKLMTIGLGGIGNFALIGHPLQELCDEDFGIPMGRLR
jgi:hypothetical protein